MKKPVRRKEERGEQYERNDEKNPSGVKQEEKAGDIRAFQYISLRLFGWGHGNR